MALFGKFCLFSMGKSESVSEDVNKIIKAALQQLQGHSGGDASPLSSEG